MRLADKREIIKLLTDENTNLKLQIEAKAKETKLQLAQIDKDTKIGNTIRNVIIALFVCGAITLLVLEFIHPEHGWIKFR
jgi:hypothetical protein